MNNNIIPNTFSSWNDVFTFCLKKEDYCKKSKILICLCWNASLGSAEVWQFLYSVIEMKIKLETELGFSFTGSYLLQKIYKYSESCKGYGLKM